MAESKMPARIAVGQHTGWAAIHTAKMKGDTVYIRADLVGPLVEALRKAEELYQVGLLNASDGLANEVVALRRAALSSWEAAQ